MRPAEARGPATTAATGPTAVDLMMMPVGAGESFIARCAAQLNSKVPSPRPSRGMADEFRPS
jgi:hypothetical protein